MVGVPGKYKGCETCRARRVKCDNQRPECQKCLDGGRQCAGYEREIVFITATLDDGGRCSSHPPRRGGGVSQKSKSRSPDHPKLDLRPIEPLRPAWDDVLWLSNHGKEYAVHVAAIHTNLQNVAREHEDQHRGKIKITLPPYAPQEFQFASFGKETDVDTQTLISLAESDGPQSSPPSILLMLAEHNACLLPNQGIAPWKLDANQLSRVRKLGPEQFKHFPAHHYFVRVYRHTAVMLALLNRQPTFLASDEWQVVPWEFYPKSPLDYLLDLLLPIPELLVRADAIIAAVPTIARRMKAQDLLSNCEAIEKHLDEWYTCFNANSVCRMGSDPADAGTPGPAYWPEDPASPSMLLSSMKIPFAECIAFRDGPAALTMATYWAGQILVYETVDVVHLAANAPLAEDWSNMSYPNFPSAASRDWQTTDRGSQASDYRLRQQQSLWRSSELAGMVCRGLDFALESGMQIDALVAPFTVAHRVFRKWQEIIGKTEQELAWCERFREMLVDKGQAAAAEMMAMGWQDVGSF